MTTVRFCVVLVCALAAIASIARAELPADNIKIFLLIGQSNMAGRGKVEAEDTQAHPRVFMLTKDLAWVPAIDPMHFDKPERIGTGLGKTFGAVVADAEPGAIIGLVPAAFGGSALDEWRPGEPHYVAALARAKEALKHGQLAGILWHQGESDRAPNLVATYPERFAKMIAQLRADLGAPDVPVILGEIGRFCDDQAGINAALAETARKIPDAAFVTTEGLTDQGDKLHFDSASFRELGRRYARAWQTLAGTKR
ncbi:MAG TPA: sialate O-acetylesterase [Candidatus Didemnitutus sp.]|nr:sialate O-acetylesterase [Candidatus Didemnitutus sp.]